MSTQLYITNLSSDTTESELDHIFARIGMVVSMRISIDPHTGAQKSYGFVEMETLELAQAAVQSMNGYLLHNRKIQVKVLGAREPQKSVSQDKQLQSRAIQRRKRLGNNKVT